MAGGTNGDSRGENGSRQIGVRERTRRHSAQQHRTGRRHGTRKHGTPESHPLVPMPGRRLFQRDVRPHPATRRRNRSGRVVAVTVDLGTPSQRRTYRNELLLVLGVSLGQSAVYAAVRLIARLTAEVPLAEQTAALNVSRSPRPLLDLTYQLLGIFFALVPVWLALHLLNR